MKKLKKVIIAIFVIAAIGGIVAFNLRDKITGEKKEKGDTVKIKRGAVVSKLKETGTIELVRTVNVKSEISGTVSKFFVDEGDKVKADQVLAIVEPNLDQAMRLYSAKAAVDRAKIELEEKKRDLERERELFEKKISSVENIEKVTNLHKLALNTYRRCLIELRMVEREIHAGQSNLDKLQSDSEDPNEIPEIQDSKVIAPISGIITARHVEEGEKVIAGTSSMLQGTTIFEIGDPSQIIVKSGISEVDLADLKVGQAVRIVADSYPEKTYHGKVKRIAPTGRIPQGSNIVNFGAEIEITDPDENLKHGMSCDVDIIFEKKENVLYLPVEAVLEIKKKDEEGEETNEVEKVIVYARGNPKFEEKEIKTGLESDNRVEILSSPLLCESDLKDPSGLAAKLRDAPDPLSHYLRGRLSEETQRLLDAYDGASPLPESLQKALIDELSSLIQGASLYDEQRFSRVTLTEKTQKLIEQTPPPKDFARLNRLLLEEAYPNQIAKFQGLYVGDEVYADAEELRKKRKEEEAEKKGKKGSKKKKKRKQEDED